jgi:hypothetical protein
MGLRGAKMRAKHVRGRVSEGNCGIQEDSQRTIHPNHGELISCDVSGAVRVVRIWDLGEYVCSYELVPFTYFQRVKVVGGKCQ